MANLAIVGSHSTNGVAAVHATLAAGSQSCAGKAAEAGADRENTPAFLFQPEVLLIYNFLFSDRDETRRVWAEHNPGVS